MTHFAGTIVARIMSAAADGALGAVVVTQHQTNSLYGVHQASVRLAGDDTVYRLIIAPADAPISIGGCDVDAHFAKPLAGD